MKWVNIKSIGTWNGLECILITLNDGVAPLKGSHGQLDVHLTLYSLMVEIVEF